jgi:hypothetical protein
LVDPDSFEPLERELPELLELPERRPPERDPERELPDSLLLLLSFSAI